MSFTHRTVYSFQMDNSVAFNIFRVVQPHHNEFWSTFITPRVSPIPCSASSLPRAPGNHSPAFILYSAVCSAHFLWNGVAYHSVLCDWLPSRSRRFSSSSMHSVYPCFIPFHGWIKFYCMDTSHLIYSFIGLWALDVFPPFGCYG